jgi:putative thioredoxin
MPDFIRSVTEGDFEYEVIAYSQNTPVITYFWADWCKPCKVLTPMLESIASEADGGFRLGKVDVDANPNLVLRFSVRTVPTVIAFSQGARTSDFAGLQPEIRVRDFISKVMPPSPAHLIVQKGDSLFFDSQYEDAEKTYQEALKVHADYPPALLGLMKTYLVKGNSDASKRIYQTFPASKEYNRAEGLIPLIRAMQDSNNQVLPAENDLDAAFSSSIRLAIRGNIFASLDGLFEILRQEKHFRRDRAKQVILSLLELLDQDNVAVKQYRKELASILF